MDADPVQNVKSTKLPCLILLPPDSEIKLIALAVNDKRYLLYKVSREIRIINVGSVRENNAGIISRNCIIGGSELITIANGKKGLKNRISKVMSVLTSIIS